MRGPRPIVDDHIDHVAVPVTAGKPFIARRIAYCGSDAEQPGRAAGEGATPRTWKTLRGATVVNARLLTQRND